MASALMSARKLRNHPGYSWFDNLFLATMVVLMAVSGGMLWNIGLNYEGLQGNVAAKIHPYTYIIVLLFFARAVQSGNPVGYFVERSRERPASLLLLTAACLLFVHIVIRNASGMAGTIDTFIGPPLIMMLLSGMGERQMRRLEVLLHVIMTTNALMGIFEFATKILIFPYRFDGEVFVNDHRSSALQGHPLANATVTAIYALALLTGGRSIPPGWKLPLFGLQFLALVTFGGRSAMVAVIIFGGGYGLVAAHRILRRGRISLGAAAATLFLMVFLPTIAVSLSLGGYFDALLERFASDGGSANARVQMFDLFKQVPFGDLLVGPDTSLMDSLRRMEGLEWGIENPVVRMVLYQGIIATTLMMIAIYLFHFEIAVTYSRGLWLPMLAFIILAQTAESFGGKTLVISKFTFIIACMYWRNDRQRSPPPTPSAAAIAGSNVRLASSINAKPSNRFQ